MYVCIYVLTQQHKLIAKSMQQNGTKYHKAALYVRP